MDNYQVFAYSTELSIFTGIMKPDFLLYMYSVVWMFGFVSLHAQSASAASSPTINTHLEKGQAALSQGRVADALTQFHAALDMDPNNFAALFQRSAVYQILGRPQMALNDLNKVMQLRPEFHSARMKRGDVFLKQGNFDSALIDFEYLVNEAKVSEEAKEKLSELAKMSTLRDEANSLFDSHQFSAAIQQFSELIQTCPWDIDSRIKRSSAYEVTGDFASAISDLRYASGLRADNTELKYKLSLLLYRNGALEESLNAIRECLRVDADSKPCKSHYTKVKKQAKLWNSAEKDAEGEKYTECAASLNKLLKQSEANVKDELPARALFDVKKKLCHCLARDASQTNEAISVCTSVLEIDDKNVDAFINRADAKLADDDFAGALEDLRAAKEIDSSNHVIDEKIKKVQQVETQANSRDYYKILGVKRNANKRQITKAYRALAKQWHPDNFQDAEEKANAEKKFIDIAAANEVLTDEEMRRKFDSGKDPLDAQQNANQGFNPFGGNFQQGFQQGGRTFFFKYG